MIHNLSKVLCMTFVKSHLYGTCTSNLSHMNNVLCMYGVCTICEMYFYEGPLYSAFFMKDFKCTFV